MSKQIAEHIKDFRQKVKAANKEFTKKEACKDLLNRLYADNDETRKVIDAISSGAETAIFNIPRKDKLHKGSADTLYNKIIIEFENDLKKTALQGKTFGGKLTEHNCNWNAAAEKLTEEDVKWFYLIQGNSSALSTRKQGKENLPNPYKNQLKQGATIVPRSLYFVDINQQMPPDFEDRILNVRTSPTVQADAKKPWTEIDFKGKMESRFLFRTALSKSILPFALFNPCLVVLPILSNETKWAIRK